METISNRIFEVTSVCGFNMTSSMDPPPPFPLKLVNNFRTACVPFLQCFDECQDIKRKMARWVTDKSDI